jgi:hypothetical protein
VKKAGGMQVETEPLQRGGDVVSHWDRVKAEMKCPEGFEHLIGLQESELAVQAALLAPGMEVDVDKESAQAFKELDGFPVADVRVWKWMAAYNSISEKLRMRFLYVDFGSPLMLQGEMLEKGQKAAMDKEPNSADFFVSTDQWKMAYRRWAVPAVALGHFTQRFCWEYLTFILQVVSHNEGKFRPARVGWHLDKLLRMHWAKQAETGCLPSFEEDLKPKNAERWKEEAWQATALYHKRHGLPMRTIPPGLDPVVAEAEREEKKRAQAEQQQGKEAAKNRDIFECLRYYRGGGVGEPPNASHTAFSQAWKIWSISGKQVLQWDENWEAGKDWKRVQEYPKKGSKNRARYGWQGTKRKHSL